jgi:hypothetical protein
MRIGVDVDNTIICYDDVFASLAIANGFDIARTAQKSDVKRWFHDQEMYDDFTRLQGQAYGSHISMAKVFDGVIAFLKEARGFACDVFLVSHKTEFPIIGEQINLHESVKNFLITQEVVSHAGYEHTISLENVFLESSIEAKLQRIRSLNLNFFIDDLPNILSHRNFPEGVSRIFFSKIKGCDPALESVRFGSWAEITRRIL